MKVREGSGGLPKVSKRVGRPAQRSERSRETPREVREGSGGPRRGLGWVGRQPRRCRKRWKSPQKSGGPHHRFERGREA